jgi:CheY-like chemotaxis protein
MQMMKSNHFDLVLCDIGLPDGSGYEVISKAKARGPIKAVAITGFGTEEDLRRSKEAGFDYHLVKPVDFQELRAVLEQVAG